MPINIDGSKGIRQNTTEVTKIPVGTTAQRPANPEAGMIRFNTDLGFIEGYDPTADEWLPTSEPPRVIATGGTVTDITQDGKQYRVHTFTSDGTFEVTRGGEVEYLVVGGGGSGGAADGSCGGGGGGAGGYISSVIGEQSGGGVPSTSPLQVSSIAYPITVGAGGSSVSGRIDGNNGENSSFGDITALGGGGGGGGSSSSSGDGFNGGSGGGGGTCASPYAGGSGESGQGFDGGQGRAAGGGGAGQVGFDAPLESGETNPDTGAVSIGAIGGEGVESAIAGSLLFRGGGGGGGGAIGGPESSVQGGVGGGGAGATSGTGDAQSGEINTGGGGGGTRAGTSGEGGSGIVIVRYRIG